MHLLDKIIIPYSFYSKSYDLNTDTIEHTLNIENSLFDVQIKVTTNNYSSIDSDYTVIDIMSDGKLHHTLDLGNGSQVEAMYYVQDFLIENHLLLYIEGFGIASFDDRVYIEQSKPTTRYESRINNKSNDR